MSLLYKGHAYIVESLANYTNIIADIGDYYVRITQYTSLMPSSITTGTVAQFQAYFADTDIGGTQLYRSDVSGLDGVQSILQSMLPNISYDFVIDSYRSYVLRIDFDNYICVSSQVLGTSGAPPLYHIIDGNSIYISGMFNGGSTVRSCYTNLVVDNITNPTTCTLFNAAPNSNNPAYYMSAISSGYIPTTIDFFYNRISPYTPPEEQYPFFLLNQYNSPSALQLNVNSDRWGYDESTSPHSNFAYGAANNARITCFKIGSMIYFCSLFRNTLTEEILYYANNISGTTGEAIDPSSWQLNQLHNIYYYYTQSYTDIFKEMPVYSSSDLSLALADAYDFLIEGADPYEEKGGASTTGGGTGNGTDGTDTQTMPGDPGLSALSLGLCTAFIPSSSALNSLANFLFGANTTILDELAKLFGDPMKAIIGLHILPVSPSTAGSGVITLGNVNTGVTSGYTATQYIDVDCGSVYVNEYWGSYLDYDPYTQYEIYLPFIGIKSLDSNDVVEHTLSVKYKVDVLSGACVCFVFSDSNLLYSYSGSCSQQIPLTESQYSNLLSGAITVAASVGSLIATEGGSAGIAIPAIASSSVNMAKQQITRSGSLTGNAGQMGIKTPFVIRHKPIQAIPGSQNSYLGYPSFITERIGNLTGYTEFYEVHLNGLTCTDEEKDELESLMKGGVLL